MGLECGIGTWDWNVGLEHGSGTWDWNIGLEHELECVWIELTKVL